MAGTNEAFTEFSKVVGEEIARLHAKIGAHEFLLEKLYVAILSAQSDGQEFIEEQLDELEEVSLTLGEANLKEADGIGSMSADYTRQFLERIRDKI